MADVESIATGVRAMIMCPFTGHNMDGWTSRDPTRSGQFGTASLIRRQGRHVVRVEEGPEAFDIVLNDVVSYVIKVPTWHEVKLAPNSSCNLPPLVALHFSIGDNFKSFCDKLRRSLQSVNKYDCLRSTVTADGSFLEELQIVHIRFERLSTADQPPSNDDVQRKPGAGPPKPARLAQQPTRPTDAAPPPTSLRHPIAKPRPTRQTPPTPEAGPSKFTSTTTGAPPLPPVKPRRGVVPAADAQSPTWTATEAVEATSSSDYEPLYVIPPPSPPPPRRSSAAVGRTISEHDASRSVNQSQSSQMVLEKSEFDDDYYHIVKIPPVPTQHKHRSQPDIDSNMIPWKCPHDTLLNVATAYECDACGQPRPDAWRCVECRYVNHVDSTGCHRCGVFRCPRCTAQTSRSAECAVCSDGW